MGNTPGAGSVSLPSGIIWYRVPSQAAACDSNLVWTSVVAAMSCYFFSPYIMEEENHDLCCVFYQILPNLLPCPPTYCYVTRAIQYLTVLYTYLAILVT